MKKILIISGLFAPRSEIGAIRWTKLAKYLAIEHDTECDVITLEKTGDQDSILEHDVEGLPIRIFRVAHPDGKPAGQYVFKQAVTAPVKAADSGFVNWLKHNRLTMSVRSAVRDKREYRGQWQGYENGMDFCRKTVECVKENGLSPEQYDAVAASFGPVGSALAALELKRLYPGMRLIMDFRDPMDNSFQSARMNRLYRRLQKELIMLSDRVITVTEGAKKEICRSSGCADDGRYAVITNGFDPDDTAGLKPVSDGKYSFAVTGSLYDGKRDNSALFEILSRLEADGAVKREDLRFNYAGRNFSALMLQAQRFGLGDILRDHGEVTRTASLQLQLSSRLLVLNTWSSRGQDGVVPGKLYEYMMMNRPIIGVITGNLPHSEARRIIERTGAGAVYEQADPGTADLLYDYIKNDYLRYKEGLDCSPMMDGAILAEYDYRSIAARIAALLLGDEKEAEQFGKAEK